MKQAIAIVFIGHSEKEKVVEANLFPPCLKGGTGGEYKYEARSMIIVRSTMRIVRSLFVQLP